MSVNEILCSIQEKIKGDEVLREILEGEGKALQYLIVTHGEARVKTAADLIDAYKLLLKALELTKGGQRW